MGKRYLQKQLALGLKLYETQQRNGIQDSAFAADLLGLDKCLQEKRYDDAKSFGDIISLRVKSSKRHSWLFRIGEFIFTLAAALLIAGVIRQTWFELYEIPTGSMRSTFKEQDRVLVSKSAFGLNTPFYTGHLTFLPNRVKRGTIVVVTGDGLDLPDVDTYYFGLFPGKKRYVKRCAALPGDTVYFYGGDLFCLTEEGTLIRVKSDPLLKAREYIPFISSFEGRVEAAQPAPFTRQRVYLLKHMDKAVGRIEINPDGTISSRILQGDTWTPEFSGSKTAPQTIGEFYGIDNFATCRLLRKEQLPQEARRLGYEDNGALCWLELHHSPTLPPSGRPKQSSFPFVVTSVTWIPLHQEECERLMRGLYTARLVVKNDRLYRYHYEGEPHHTISLPTSIPDGCYEFYNGTAYEIGFGGHEAPLAASHPLYPKSIKELCFWFNAGIDASADVLVPTSQHMPTRFAYFNNGDLFVMGEKVFEKGNPILAAFDEKEIARQTKDYSYFAFQDAGSPEQEPSPVAFMQNFGFKVPENYYLLLGDNPAMSVDSRFFGPVPQQNLQGTPVLLFWPFGPRWGQPTQPYTPLSPFSLAFITITGVSYAVYVVVSRRRTRQRIQKLRQESSSDL